MPVTLYRAWKYTTPSAKSQIKTKMDYYWYIWAGDNQSPFSSFDRLQKPLHGLLGDELCFTLKPLFHRRNIAGLQLLYRYFHGRRSIERHSLVSLLKPSQLGPSRPRTFRVDYSSYSLYSIGKFHSGNFFLRITLWNRHSQDIIITVQDILMIYTSFNAFTSFFKTLPWVAHWSCIW